MVGSVARQAQNAGSDLDLVAVTREPTFTKRHGSLLRLKAEGVDFNAVSSSLLSKIEQGATTPFAPLLLTWRADGVLIHGTDTLPHRISPLDRHARAVFAFFVSSWFLWHFVAAGDSVGFVDREFSRQWMVKTAGHMRDEWTMDDEWRRLGGTLAAEIDAHGDPRAVCRLLSEELESRLGDLEFSESDHRRYVAARLRSQKKVSRRTGACRTPVQERALRALYLLFASGSGDLELIAGVPPTLRDFVRLPRARDSAALWNAVQRSVLHELQLVLASGEILIA